MPSAARRCSCSRQNPRWDVRPAFQARFLSHTLPALRRALTLSRAAGLEVIHTVIANLTADRRDSSFDYKRCGMGIDHTVKDAADRGYRVICLSDACQAETEERHEAALACFRGVGQQLSVEELATALRAP